MRWKLLNADPPVTYAVALQTDEEVMPALEKFIREHEIEAATVTAIGAFSEAVLGYFDWGSKEYRKNPVAEQVEVVSLLGDVAVAESGPVLHVHAVLGKADGSAVYLKEVNKLPDSSTGRAKGSPQCAAHCIEFRSIPSLYISHSGDRSRSLPTFCFNRSTT